VNDNTARKKHLEKVNELLNTRGGKNPDHANARATLGWLYYRHNQLEAAEKQIILALKLMNGHAMYSRQDTAVYERAGDVYLALTQKEKAISNYALALENCDRFVMQDEKQRIKLKVAALSE